MKTLDFLVAHPEVAKEVRLEINGADLIAFGEFVAKRATEAGRKEPIVNEVYLTPAEMSEALHVSLVTLWEWDRKGITRPLKIGNRKRYRKSDLEKILTRDSRSTDNE